MPNEDAVHNVVKQADYLSHYSRERHLPEKAGNGGCFQFTGFGAHENTFIEKSLFLSCSFIHPSQAVPPPVVSLLPEFSFQHTGIPGKIGDIEMLQPFIYMFNHNIRYSVSPPASD